MRLWFIYLPLSLFLQSLCVGVSEPLLSWSRGKENKENEKRMSNSSSGTSVCIKLFFKTGELHEELELPVHCRYQKTTLEQESQYRGHLALQCEIQLQYWTAPEQFLLCFLVQTLLQTKTNYLLYRGFWFVDGDSTNQNHVEWLLDPKSLLITE